MQSDGSVPSIIDRCLQAIVKNALEPCWEALFEGTSYGFRPGRSPHDAIEKIYGICRPNKRKKWVVDADIQGCFDNIDHEYLMKRIGNFPSRKLIYQWLKSGVMDKGVFQETQSGTPQGGIISPLLANIALHGMEQALGIKYDYRGQSIGNRIVVRYADDFCVFCETKEDALKCLEAITGWLAQRGLNISSEKTSIKHLTEGFDFLGFHIRHYRDSNTTTGWKLLTKPSAKSVQKVRAKLRDIWLSPARFRLPELLEKLNSVIRGWANYFRTGVSKEVFSGLDQWMFIRERRHTRRMHPKKGWKWRQKRYFGTLNLHRRDKWVFGDKSLGAHVLKFSWFDIERHTLVKGASSPDDPDLRDYWRDREKKKVRNLRNKSRQTVAKNQDHQCPKCGESLYNGEELHLHHVKPKSEGGKDTYNNLRLLHLYCHQQVHRKKIAL